MVDVSFAVGGLEAGDSLEDGGGGAACQGSSCAELDCVDDDRCDGGAAGMSSVDLLGSGCDLEAGGTACQGSEFVGLIGIACHGWLWVGVGAIGVGAATAVGGAGLS